MKTFHSSRVSVSFFFFSFPFKITVQELDSLYLAYVTTRHQIICYKEQLPSTYVGSLQESTATNSVPSQMTV